MRNRWRIYGVLVILRLLIAFTSFSIIHPDEHFQNPEITADLVFDYSRNGAGPLKTWEWLGNEPCRSIVPVWISSGVAFNLVKALNGNSKHSQSFRRLKGTDRLPADPSAKTLFYAERLAMFLLSLVIGMSRPRPPRDARANLSYDRYLSLPHFEILPLPSTLRLLSNHFDFPRSPILKFD